MSIFAIFIVVIAAPLLARLAKIVAYVVVFPLAMLALCMRSFFSPASKKTLQA